MSSEDSASFPPVIGAKLVPYRTTPVLFISEIDHDKYPDINNDYIFEIDPKGDEEDE